MIRSKIATIKQRIYKRSALFIYRVIVKIKILTDYLDSLINNQSFECFSNSEKNLLINGWKVTQIQMLRHLKRWISMLGENKEGIREFKIIDKVY